MPVDDCNKVEKILYQPEATTMKLRISGDSIRFRLGRAEVARVGDGQRVEERAHLSPTPFVYAISSSVDSTQPSASFADGTLEVILPLVLVRDWAQSSQVGITTDLPAGGDGLLRLLIEKDFKCLQGDDEHQRDTFPYPKEPAGS